MVAAILAAALVFSPQILNVPQIRFFPGGYFDSTVKKRIQRRALAEWPGATGLGELWRSGELDEAQQMALLLGGAGFHDTDLLPVYMEAIRSPHVSVRQAAAYGYRDLIGDRAPSVAGGLSEEASLALLGEMEAVSATLRMRPLAAVWLNSLLGTEGKTLPEWRGVVLRRSADDCLRALDTIAQGHDLEVVVQTYRLTGEQRIRLSLMKLLESLALKRFFEIPKGERVGWGMENIEHGLEALDIWLDDWQQQRCDFDFEAVLQSSFAEMGASNLPPLSAQACSAWQQVLLNGPATWWPQASRRLYHCGGPAIGLSVFQTESEQNQKARDALIRWYRLR